METRRKRRAPAAPTEPGASARAAGLRYVRDDMPGIRRRRAGRGFAYVGPDGQPVRDEETAARIRSLAVPPAWSDVWISPIANGHLQATGRDARGRKQYRYHPRWKTIRDETKYERMVPFGKALPAIRRRIDRDLRRPGLPREKVLAAVVRLLETTLVRVGNEEYVRSNGSFGLTTLRDRHAKISGSTVRFEFRGKGGKVHRVGVEDPRLAHVVRQCRDIPGYELFQWVEGGQRQAIDSSDINEYLRGITGQDFTAKDFRTWAGTVLASLALQEFEAFDSETQAKRNIVEAIETVAARLGNTATICRKCYVHPAVLESYLDGTMLKALGQRADVEMEESLSELRPEEAAVLALLRRRLAKAA